MSEFLTGPQPSGPWLCQVQAILAARRETRPAPTLGKVISFAEAVATGRYVDAATVAARYAICETCDQARRDADGIWCGVCGCGVGKDAKRIRNLAAYVERLPKYGCKHPQRAHGKGWPISS